MIATYTDVARQFDEAVARVLCAKCAGRGYTSRSEHDPGCKGDGEQYCARTCPVEVQEECDHRDLIPVASCYRGHIQEANGCSIDVIVQSARAATICNGRLNRCKCHQPIPPVRYYALRGDDGHCSECRWEFAVAAFAAAIVNEGIALGERETCSDGPGIDCSRCNPQPIPSWSWFDGRERFKINGRAFVIPAITFGAVA
jgi:hypothetical protein